MCFRFKIYNFHIHIKSSCVQKKCTNGSRSATFDHYTKRKKKKYTALSTATAASLVHFMLRARVRVGYRHGFIRGYQSCALQRDFREISVQIKIKKWPHSHVFEHPARTLCYIHSEERCICAMRNCAFSWHHIAWNRQIFLEFVRECACHGGSAPENVFFFFKLSRVWLWVWMDWLTFEEGFAERCEEAIFLGRKNDAHCAAPHTQNSNFICECVSQACISRTDVMEEISLSGHFTSSRHVTWEDMVNYVVGLRL